MDTIYMTRTDKDTVFEYMAEKPVSESNRLLGDFQPPFKEIKISLGPENPLTLLAKNVGPQKIELEIHSHSTKTKQINWICRIKKVPHIHDNNVPAYELKIDTHPKFDMYRKAMFGFSGTYIYTMIYIANHQPDIKQSEYRPDCTKLSRKERRAIEREEYKNPVTYIFKTSKNGMTLTNQNQEKSHHASPSCSFNVRGHWRTYKTGRRIWVNEYTKGKGKPHKDKLYMLDNTNTIVLS